MPCYVLLTNNEAPNSVLRTAVQTLIFRDQSPAFFAEQVFSVQVISVHTHRIQETGNAIQLFRVALGILSLNGGVRNWKPYPNIIYERIFRTIKYSSSRSLRFRSKRLIGVFSVLLVNISVSIRNIHDRMTSPYGYAE